MFLKKIPEDFIVDEIYNLDVISKKDEQRNNSYSYFILKKKNYAQIRAIQKVAKIFNTSAKLINFSGTKDKVGITTQLISIYNLKKEVFEKNLSYLNNEVEDIWAEYLGEFKSRLNLGDNDGNKFKITIREISDEQINLAKINIDKIRKEGLLNYFDEQRFGYANNSHIVGRYLLKDEINLAVKEILTSCPKNPTEYLKKYTDFLNENWDRIVEQDETVVVQIKEIIPRFLQDDLKIINHLIRAKNDFYGAFRHIPKKIRTLYINAYQSYIFNEILITFKDKNLPEQLELIHEDIIFENKDIQNFVLELLKKDEVNLDDFKLKRMPELKLRVAKRITKNFPKNLKIIEISDDELVEDKNSINNKKIIVEFDLNSGEYATNVVKQLF